jgi:DNA-binding CsgD family transcriptional regulator
LTLAGWLGILEGRLVDVETLRKADEMGKHEQGQVNIVKRVQVGNLLDTLTAHEEAVFALLFEGVARADIAEKLNLSEPTVKYHLAHIYKKLGVAGRAEAVAYAASMGRKVVKPEVRKQPERRTDGAWCETQIREAGQRLAKAGIYDRKLVNVIVADLLATLYGHIE